MSENLERVRRFWESNPLWQGESEFAVGTKEFFEEHRTTVIQDCFAGVLDPLTIPVGERARNVLDLGCGPGFWTVELSNYCEGVTAADLTEQALSLCQQRAEFYGLDNIAYSLQNAEKMTFPDKVFSHVNCQGVIHHTPDTEACVSEISRVLENQGTASISVYYKNFFLRNWVLFRWVGVVLSKLGARLQGRGRENIYTEESIDEIVRLYDGSENPIGKAYTKREFIELLSKFFEINEIKVHFFPVRTLSFSVPGILHRFLDRNFGFMIYATVTRK